MFSIISNRDISHPENQLPQRFNNFLPPIFEVLHRVVAVDDILQYLLATKQNIIQTLLIDRSPSQHLHQYLLKLVIARSHLYRQPFHRMHLQNIVDIPQSILCILLESLQHTLSQETDQLVFYL